MPESREDQLSDRAEKVGYTLMPPTGDRWLMADKTDGWLTFASLGEVDEYLYAEEEGNDGCVCDDPDLIGPDDPAPPFGDPSYRPYGTPPWACPPDPPGDPADPVVFGEDPAD